MKRTTIPVIGSVVPVQVMRTRSNAILPTYANDGDAGFDLYATEGLILCANRWALISTGIAVAVPTGYVLQICSRSGMALKNGIFVLNAPGIVDSGYRGEVGVILHNTSSRAYRIKEGDRIAQGVIVPVITAALSEVEAFTEQTERGSRGFGSSGG